MKISKGYTQGEKVKLRSAWRSKLTVQLKGAFIWEVPSFEIILKMVVAS